MRNNIIHIGANELKYEIRGIIKIAKQIEKIKGKMIWENIGDPVAKGHKLPDWMKEIIMKETQNDLSYGYCPTKGLDETREFLAEKNNKIGGAQIKAEDIIFFNGLGDAISTFYQYLNMQTRVIGPEPAYSTHSSAEAAHSGSPHLTYELQPQNNWMPNLEDLYNKVKYNPLISGILIINPDNPTGSVYPRSVLEEIVQIARKFDLFIIVDEIYMKTVYNGQQYTALCEVIEDVPGVAMKGISKEFPWPGSRCGWIESYNINKDAVFAEFINSLENAKMLEVCSTTLPQKVIPAVLQHPQYETYHQKRNQFFEKRSQELFDTLKDVKGLTINMTNGSFYSSPVFEIEHLHKNQSLPISGDLYQIITPELENVENDKKFALYLMANTGICVVPLSSFNTKLKGFRMTLLESDDKIFTDTCQKLKTAIRNYLLS